MIVGRSISPEGPYEDQQRVPLIGYKDGIPLIEEKPEEYWYVQSPGNFGIFKDRFGDEYASFSFKNLVKDGNPENLAVY